MLPEYREVLEERFVRNEVSEEHPLEEVSQEWTEACSVLFESRPPFYTAL